MEVVFGWYPFKYRGDCGGFAGIPLSVEVIVVSLALCLSLW